MKPDNDIKALTKSGMIGIGWATTGGEAASLFNEKYLAADGIENRLCPHRENLPRPGPCKPQARNIL